MRCVSRCQMRTTPVLLCAECNLQLQGESSMHPVAELSAGVCSTAVITERGSSDSWMLLFDYLTRSAVK